MKNLEKTVKEVKMHNFLVCACTSQDFAQSQKFFAQLHDRETLTFSNSGQHYVYLPNKYILPNCSHHCIDKVLKKNLSQSMNIKKMVEVSLVYMFWTPDEIQVVLNSFSLKGKLGFIQSSINSIYLVV